MEIQNERIEDEAFWGSVFSDFPQGFPCGVLRCSCEKYPKVLYANEWIFDILGIRQDSEYWQEYLRDNLYFAIPSEQWPLIRKAIRQTKETMQSVPLEHRVKNEEGIETELVGWVRAVECRPGHTELLFLYLRIPDYHQNRDNHQEKAYRSLLADVYDGVFRIERKNHIVECLSIKERLNSRMYFMPGMRIIMDSMLQKSYYMLVYSDDRERMGEFFEKVSCSDCAADAEPCRLEFRTIGQNILREFELTAVNLDEDTALMCCQEMTEIKSARRRAEQMKRVQSINAEMGENIDSSGFEMWVYRILDRTVFPQSGDMPYLTDRGIPLEQFLHDKEIPEEKYQEALAAGEVSLENPNPEIHRRLYLSSRNTSGQGQENLLVLCELRKSESKEKMEEPRVTIHTFGYFDVLVDGKPIVFPHEKSKEMLALMVDRKGSFVGNPYFISCLWEDEPYGEKIQSRCRQTAFRMMETLKRYGIQDIIEKADGHRRIVPEKVKCDYFDYINGKEQENNHFNGTYMMDYSWGEETLSTLLREKNFNREPEKTASLT